MSTSQNIISNLSIPARVQLTSLWLQGKDIIELTDCRGLPLDWLATVVPTPHTLDLVMLSMSEPQRSSGHSTGTSQLKMGSSKVLLISGCFGREEAWTKLLTMRVTHSPVVVQNWLLGHKGPRCEPQRSSVVLQRRRRPGLGEEGKG